MRSPKAMKIKSKINPGSAAESSGWEFNTYKSGGSISLPHERMLSR